MKSVVNRVALQLQKALPEKGFALLVNHGIPEEKVNMKSTYNSTRPCKLVTAFENCTS